MPASRWARASPTGLDRRLEAEGLTVAEVTGTGVDAWL
jgi:hypothetical protein